MDRLCKEALYCGLFFRPVPTEQYSLVWFGMVHNYLCFHQQKLGRVPKKTYSTVPVWSPVHWRPKQSQELHTLQPVDCQLLKSCF